MFIQCIASSYAHMWTNPSPWSKTLVKTTLGQTPWSKYPLGLYGECALKADGVRVESYAEWELVLKIGC